MVSKLKIAPMYVLYTKVKNVKDFERSGSLINVPLFSLMILMIHQVMHGHSALDKEDLFYLLRPHALGAIV